MKLKFLTSALICMAFSTIPTSTFSKEGDMWVTADKLSRRTCPSTNCGIVGWLIEGEKITIFEEKNNWVRITKRYYASCLSGESEYVDKGNKRCVAENGIVNGEFAEWVSKRFLTTSGPKKQIVFNSAVEKAISSSDNFQQYREAFLEISNKLVDGNQCTINDFEQMGGWLKATGNNMSKPIYFTYCGGMTKNNKVYINVKSKTVLN